MGGKLSQTSVCIVAIETTGNQSFIFGSNRLAENLGASEIIYRIGTVSVLRAAGMGEIEARPREIASALLDRKRNRPILGDDAKVEVVVATSGKAILLARSREIGECIVRQVTREALKAFPGAGVVGAVGDAFDYATATAAAFHAELRNVFARLAATRIQVPPSISRDLTVPIVRPCRTTGLPAKAVCKFGKEEPAALSRTAISKRRHRDNGIQRLKATLEREDGRPNQREDGRPKLLRQVGELEAEDWLAVVHADGNGLGGLFQAFDKPVGVDKPARTYVDVYRRFSIALDFATIAAVRQAILDTWGGKEAKIVPVVLGGDDLTAICEGVAAFRFAETYLAAFREETGKPRPPEEHPALRDVLPKVLGRGLEELVRGSACDRGSARDCLEACAGVAVVKTHFPFHRAYDLSAALVGSAKKLIRADGGQAIDFHVQLDGSAHDLDAIRARLSYSETTDQGIAEGDRRSERKVRLYARPYRFDGSLAPGTWGALKKAVEALRASEEQDSGEGPKGLPRSQQHALLKALYLGKSVADGKLAEVRHRYAGFDWDSVLLDEGSLFGPQPEDLDDAGGLRALLLDALVLADLGAIATSPDKEEEATNEG